MAITVLEENPSYVYDDSIGIVIPKAILGEGRWYPHPFDSVNSGFVRAQGILSFDKKLGVILGHDAATGVAFWPAYASGFDDMLMRAMVQGYMANVGQTPVPITLLSTIVTKIQSMVGTWIMTLRGKTSPVKKTLDLMARAQDSQFGSAEFVRLYMGALLVENRGAMGAQVPIETIPFDNWGEYNMVAEPIAGADSNENLFLLTMTDEAFRENQGLWMIDGLTCFPTGNSEYPYWFRTWSTEEKRDMWVLIHRDFGWQMLNEAGGRNTLYPGFGQSGAWRFSPYAVKHMAIDRQDWEHILNQPARGVVWVSGLDYPTQFRDQMQSYEEEREEQEMYFYPGVFFGGSRGENSDIKMIPWSEPPAGYTAEGWRKEWVDNLAAAYHLNVTHLEVRLGEGAMTQSDIASSLEAETAIAVMKEHIEALFNHVAPPRVMISVIWQTDRLKRYQVETFDKLATGIGRVQSNAPAPAPAQAPEVDEDGEPIEPAGPVETPEPEEQTFTREEIRGLFEEYIGIEIPEMEGGDTVEPDKKTGEDVEEGIWSRAYQGLTLGEYCQDHLGNDLDEMIEVLQPGTIIETATGQMGRIRRWNGTNSWIWIETNDGYLMLVDIYRLYAWKEFGAELKQIAREILQKIKPDHGDTVLVAEYNFKPGDRAKTASGTPCTVVAVADEHFVFVKFDWDADNIEPRGFAKKDLQPSGFKPEGEPLEPATEVVLDPDQAADDARDTWEEYADDDVKDLI